MNNYRVLIRSIGSLLERGRKQAAATVNHVIIKTYWEIGRQIVEYQQAGESRAKYGSSLLEQLSADLSRRYQKGFSVDNLQNMRNFYLSFRKYETVSRKLSWSHYCLILRINNPLARDFYAVESEKERWSVRELDRQINSMLFERLALSKNKRGVLELSKRGHIIERTCDIVKDPYVLDFLGLVDEFTEADLEHNLIKNLEKFLLELGKGFMFVERQKRITLDGEHFYIDIVFYNRIIRCFVLIELKLGKLTHKDLGQLQMYVNYYDRNIKSKAENPTVGILLCADKKDAIVKYTLPLDNKQIFASKYKLYLPNKEEFTEKLKELMEG